MSNTPVWNKQLITKQDGFTIVLSFLEEDTQMKHHFIEVCGMSESDYNDIQGYYWFTAKVTAYMGTIECGSAYLGSCCYKNLSTALGADINSMLGGYMPQLIDEAMEEAKAAIGTEHTAETVCDL